MPRGVYARTEYHRQIVSDSWKHRKHGRETTPEQKFILKIDRNGSIPQHREGLGACWNWLGRCNTEKRAEMYLGRGKYAVAARVVWKLFYGEIPQDLCVLHKCDNPTCLNPIHLFLGTQETNRLDARQKGRSTCF